MIAQDPFMRVATMTCFSDRLRKNCLRAASPPRSVIRVASSVQPSYYRPPGRSWHLPPSRCVPPQPTDELSELPLETRPSPQGSLPLTGHHALWHHSGAEPLIQADATRPPSLGRADTPKRSTWIVSPGPASVGSPAPRVGGCGASKTAATAHSVRITQESA